MSQNGNYVDLHCFGFDTNIVEVEGQVFLMDRFGNSTIKNFYFTNRGLYNSTLNIYYPDWSYAKITSAVAYNNKLEIYMVDQTPAWYLIR